MSWQFSDRSKKALEGVHPDLVKVMHATLAISPLDFGVIEGLRSPERQHELFQTGKTQLDYPAPPGHRNGPHLSGNAVDFLVYINGKATETDLDAYRQVADAAKKAALDLHVPIHWGGDNPHWKDEDHIELDPAVYPDAPLVA